MGGKLGSREFLPLLGPELYTASPWGLAPCPALLWSEEQDLCHGWLAVCPAPHAPYRS